MPYPTPPSSTAGPVGEGNYTVAQGDCVKSIAVKTGYFWETIWDLPQNASLKKVRISPNVLLPGDRLYIPEKRLKMVDRPTEKTHRFVRKGVPSKLRLCVKRAGEARANTSYQLIVDGALFAGKTDKNGCIEVTIPPDARSGRLTVGDHPLDQQVVSLELGGMDPVTEPVGIQKRLHNLGFGCESTGEIDGQTSAVIAMFQKGEGLEPTGEPDRSTLEKLQQRHGS